MLELVEAVAACLDQDSARRLTRLQLDVVTWKRLRDLRESERRGTQTIHEATEMAQLIVASNFVAQLQRKSRAFLRISTGLKA